jgi:hypothetical protein
MRIDCKLGIAFAAQCFAYGNPEFQEWESSLECWSQSCLVSQHRPWPECCLDKILGGSFTGELSVDPTHLRALRQTSSNELQATEPLEASVEVGSAMEAATSERRRRIRDAVEAALSDVIPFESGSGYWKP